MRLAIETERHVCDARRGRLDRLVDDAGDANATFAWTSPVAGLNTSPCAPAARSYALPSIQWVIVFVGHGRALPRPPSGESIV